MGGLKSALDTDLHSFPSGHTATAVGLAISLDADPRGRWLFAVFAALASLQRMTAGAHYLSDSLFGAALACLVRRSRHGPPDYCWLHCFEDNGLPAARFLTPDLARPRQCGHSL